jgi:nucleoside-diphosphate-sugar epimerase
MKVLVTGAAGQVGCRLVRQLLERNHEVRGTL